MHPREAPPTTSVVPSLQLCVPAGRLLTHHLQALRLIGTVIAAQGFPEGTRTQPRNAAAPPTRAHEQLWPDALTTAHERAAWQQERAAMEDEYAACLSVPFEYLLSAPLEAP